MSSTFLYLIFSLYSLGQTIQVLFWTFFVIASIACIIYFFGNDFDEFIDKFKLLKIKKIYLIISIITLIFTCFVPSKEDLVEIYLIPKIANNELIKNVPDYIQQYIKKELLEKNEDKK